MKRIIPTLLCCLLAFGAVGQNNDYSLSEPISISNEGWNKAVLLKNGNTVLFHFENRKGIVVKVFDSTRKEIATQKHLCNKIDINQLSTAFLDGIFEVGNEVVMFTTQQYENKETLLRLRIDGVTGRVISEDVVLQSPSFSQRIIAYVLRTADGYNILAYNLKAGDASEKLKLTRYNDKHEEVTTLPIEVEGLDPAQMSIAGITMDRTGALLVSIKMAQMNNGVAEPYLALIYKPAAVDKFIVKKMKLPTTEVTNIEAFSFNPFSKALNILVRNDDLGNANTTAQVGRLSVVSATKTRFFLIFNEVLGDMQQAFVENIKLQQYYQERTDTTQFLSPTPVHMSTSDFGVTGILYMDKHGVMNKKTGALMETRLGHYGLTMYDDKGAEIWGVVLPRHTLVTGNNYASVFKGRSSDEQLTFTQYVPSKRNQYIIFNGLRSKFADSSLVYTDSSYNISISDAMYYNIDRKKNVQKKYLFGEPSQNEYSHIYAGSGDFYADRQTYVTLMRKNVNGKETIHLAWCKLEE